MFRVGGPRLFFGLGVGTFFSDILRAGQLKASLGTMPLENIICKAQLKIIKYSQLLPLRHPKITDTLLLLSLLQMLTITKPRDGPDGVHCHES